MWFEGLDTIMAVGWVMNGDDDNEPPPIRRKPHPSSSDWTGDDRWARHDFSQISFCNPCAGSFLKFPYPERTRIEQPQPNHAIRQSKRHGN